MGVVGIADIQIKLEGVLIPIVVEICEAVVYKKSCVALLSITKKYLVPPWNIF